MKCRGESRPSDKGGEGRSSRPWDGGGGGQVSKKNSFGAFGSQFDLKIRGPPRPTPPPPPWICHWNVITEKYGRNSLTLAILINSGYSLKVSSDSGSWEKKVKQRQRNKAQLSYHDKWRDGVPLLTQRGWKSLILQGSTDFWIQNLRSFPDFSPKQ